MYNKKYTYGAWAALIAGLTFGVNSIIVKFANNAGLHTFDLLVFQMVIPLVYFTIRSKISTSNNSNLEKNSILGNIYNWVAGLTVVATSLFYYIAIQEMDPSLASIGLFQYPWLFILIGFLIYGHKINKIQLVSMAILWLGSMLLVSASFQEITLLGAISGILAGLSFAGYLFSLRYVSNHKNTKPFIFLIATVIAIVIILFNISSINIFSLNALLFGTVTAALGQIITFELLSFAAKNTRPVIMAALTTVELPVAMVVTWVIWGPYPTLIKYIGLFIMIGAVIWMKLEEKIPEKPKLKKAL
ncbi:DMT family transporter [Halalkalibacter alkalisediminis]|uniref:DMT family transporter n=1 Tax=Halalkalibacter alkalisediminis TaxID=935616 RepID=A0ABV6NN25_9BACI|nr:DMT family transporter [Halalkalibacter alkalisediminis]